MLFYLHRYVPNSNPSDSVHEPAARYTLLGEDQVWDHGLNILLFIFIFTFPASRSTAESNIMFRDMIQDQCNTTSMAKGNQKIPTVSDHQGLKHHLRRPGGP